MQRSLPLLIAGFVVISCSLTHAQGTKLWSQSRFEQLEKGTPNGVAVLSDGELVAGPSTTLVSKTPSTYVWSIASDKSGNAYVGTGSPATVLKITPDGKTTKMFSTKDVSVQAVCVGPDGSVYAATLPSGKVYKLAPDAKDLTDATAKVAFDPAKTTLKPKYVWALAFDKQGRLYIAAGGPAGVYRIDPGNPGAAPELFFKSDEQHIRCLAFDAQGDLIAGSDGTGLVYRINPAGKGYVIYDAPRQEVTAVSVGPNGDIYASSVGAKGTQTLPPLPVTGQTTVTIKIIQPGSMDALSSNSVIPQGSVIDEIAPNGSPRTLWTDADDVVYALRWTPNGLLAATGNRGRIYRIQEDGTYADIAHLQAAQAIGFAKSAHGLYVGTANTGKLYRLSSGDAAEGTYRSRVFDAGVFSQWGRAEVQTGPDSGAYELYARVGNINNPKRAWSDWKQVTPNAGPLGVEPARFVQWKAVLHPGADITSVGIDYLPVNVAPVVKEIMVQPGARVIRGPVDIAQANQIAINFPAKETPGVVSFSMPAESQPLLGLKDRTFITVRWLAHDDNGDTLEYSVYYRGIHQHNWLLLRKHLHSTFFSFNSDLLPDGYYRIKVVASDAPSHDPGQALTGARVSNQFLIDTTPPAVTGITAQLRQNKVHVQLTATDATSPISHAEYSIDAGPWQYAAPVGQIADSLTERFDFEAQLPPNTQGGPAAADASEHVITVRVFDRADNAVTTKAVVH